MSPGELTDLIEQCTWGMDADSALVKALHRGIGVHHSGLPTKYRQVVEILFRCHYLRVVIATGDICCCRGKACLAPHPKIAVQICKIDHQLVQDHCCWQAECMAEWQAGLQRFKGQFI